MLDFFSGTIYIHFQKAGSSRNNYCIGLSFELIVRRVAARVYTLLSFLFWGSAGCGAPCGRRRLSRVQSYTPSPAPCKTRHSLTLPPKKGFAVVRLCGLSPLTGAPPPYPRYGWRLVPPLTVLSHRFLFFYFTHPYLREQALHFCRKAKKTSQLRSNASRSFAALHSGAARRPRTPMRTAVLLLETWGLSAKPDVLRRSLFSVK